jgi:hypothetical protein
MTFEICLFHYLICVFHYLIQLWTILFFLTSQFQEKNVHDIKTNKNTNKSLSGTRVLQTQGEML